VKWLLYLLVLANAAFFAWQYQLREAARAATAAQQAAEPAYVTRLVMLSEVAGTADGTAGRVADAAPETGPAAVAEAPPAPPSAPPEPVRQDPAASHSSAAAPTGVAAPEPVPTPAVVAAAPVPQESGLAPVAEAAPAAPAVALPGRPPEPTPAAPAPSPAAGARAGNGVPGPPAEAATDRRRCYSVGPLAEDAPVDALRAWLQQQGAQVKSRVEQRQEPRSFWVYIPPAPSAAAARETADRLQADGVKDVMRMSAGAMANAISLGLYNRRAAADQRVAELKRGGYAAEVETRFKEVRETWLDAAFEGSRELPREGLRTAFPQLKATGATCR
jgi:hypothetical protein